MSKIDALNNNSNYYINSISNSSTPRYAVSYTGGLESDVYEGSANNTKNVAGGLVGLATLAASTLYLWKGKGWSKIQSLYNRFFNKAVQKAPKVVNRSNPDVVEEIVQKQTKQADIINNIETKNASVSARKAAERAVIDTPTPAQQAAYDKAIAYQAPTKEEAKIIEKINKEAAEKTAEAHQIGNLVPEAQAKALADAGKTVSNKVKHGTYISKDGYTLTYNKGNIEKIVTPDGRTITKPKTICKYEQKIDLSELKQSVREAA